MTQRPRRQRLPVCDQFFGVEIVHADSAAAVAAVRGQGAFWWLRARVGIGAGQGAGHAMALFLSRQLSMPIHAGACGVRGEPLQCGMTSNSMPGISRRHVLAGGLGLAALAALPARATPRCDPDADWIPSDAFLQDLPRQMQALGVPGVGIAVVEAGALAWSRCFGVTHAERGPPVEGWTLWEAATPGQPVFASTRLS